MRNSFICPVCGIRFDFSIAIWTGTCYITDDKEGDHVWDIVLM